MMLDEDLSTFQRLALLDEAMRGNFVGALDREEGALADIHWSFLARPSQLPPRGAWQVWLVMAGRGFGKTRAGAEWVRHVAERDGRARIALVAANLGEARRVMVEGESGLLAIAPPQRRPHFEPSLRRLRWANGAEATLYSAADPESLRGGQHSHGWCDEIGKWNAANGHAVAAWDNLMLGLRLGKRPQVAATTTPRATELVQRLVSDPATMISQGRMHDNSANLPPSFIAAMDRLYGGSQLGRQELDGELLVDVEGALWSRRLIEQGRVAARSGLDSDLRRIVIGVDPPASASGDACGIIVCALTDQGRALVLDDASVMRASPERWARAVADSAAHWQADRIVAEANQGGDMVRSVLHAADVNLPVRLVHASRGKAARAEPVAALYEAGRVAHAGQFARLEDQLCGLMPGGGYAGPGRSPDRADACVWALTELLLARRSEPRVRI